LQFDREEYKRWMLQAEHTLASARRDLSEGDFNWACFKAQQAAEYALKGLLYGVGVSATGHSILRLLRSLEKLGLETGEELLTAARLLDRHYIPTRYVNAHAVGSPFEFYDEPTGREAIRAAEAILKFVREVASRLAGGPL